jgi:cobalt-zinc-cadmium efflux system membrane fusion protein
MAQMLTPYCVTAKTRYMKKRPSRSALTTPRMLVAIVVVLALAIGAWATSAHWLPNGLLTTSAEKNSVNHTSDHTHPHKESGYDHDHTAHGQGHGQENSIELSENALKNIGYQPVTVALGAFERKVSIPGIVVEQAGRTQIHITSSVTGIVTKIRAFNGEAVEPDSPMFQLRLTHEEVVTAQKDYLLTSESLAEAGGDTSVWSLGAIDLPRP